MEKKIPGALWISIAVLGAAILMSFVIGVQTGSNTLLVGVFLNVALLVGLLLGHKWAYIATLIFGIGGPIVIVAMGKNAEHTVGILVGNSLIVVPVIISTRFFFPGQPKNLDGEKPGTGQA